MKRGELDWSAMDAATRAEFEELFAASDTITHPFNRIGAPDSGIQ